LVWTGQEFLPNFRFIRLCDQRIWFLKRLIADGLDRKLLHEEELFNILWDDTTCRIRQQGDEQLLVNKHLLQVSGIPLALDSLRSRLYRILGQAGRAHQELRKIDGSTSLAGQICRTRTDHLDRLAWYVEANCKYLDGLAG
jgi:hypothetical protein